MPTIPPPKTVTMGGGHGQAALLAALRLLPCSITAIVSVADDGGCSGKLREEVGMPPPGDLRRCLSTLARNRNLADAFELRLLDAHQEARSVGNLALFEAYQQYGSLQKAVDWAAELLQCAGRVVPVAESPGVLVVYDLRDGRIEGETHAQDVSSPMVAMVHGPTKTNPVAVSAIQQADFILLGPGSFFTSILATLTTADVAEAVAKAKAKKVLIANLVEENDPAKSFEVIEYIRLLRDHLTIASIGEEVTFSVLRHHDGDDELGSLPDGTPIMSSRVCYPGQAVHDPILLSRALSRYLGFPAEKAIPSVPPPPNAEDERKLQEHVEAAKRKLRTM
ncbi:MAG TPA: 2-phospho-L-lactate transferase CofD family protein [Polyangiaceae bacterium]|nr:2-phospho-L-lactate transferase CofD family protein [Polyangiaceae bacterium]